LVCLPAGIDYALSVSKDKYLFHSEHFNLTETATFDQPFTLKIALQPITEGASSPTTAAPIVLNNVFFATGSAELQASSTAELDQLAALLQQNTTLRIQIDGHTDNVGDAQSNQRLSEQRAQSVLQYLVSKGIAADRLRAKGFGMSQPIGPNDTEEGRKRNRRTAFEVWGL
jgi:outer membrane protein OmpA-like peptidoglycan-associated protein